MSNFHSHNDRLQPSLDELLEEAELIGNVKVDIDWMDIIRQNTSIRVTSRRWEGLIRLYNPVSDFQISVLVDSVNIDRNTFTYIVRDDTTRTSKFSKMMNLIGISSEEMKKVMTLYNARFRKIGLYSSSKYFYWHYKMMDDLDITSSCMSHDPYSFNITIDSGRYNPLVAYENDPRWHLLLLKDESREGYPFTARAVSYEKDLANCEYGDGVTMREAFDALGIETDQCFNGCELEILETDNDEIVFPYIDGAVYCEVDHCSSQIFLDTGNTESEGGLAREGWYCEHCQENHSEDIYQICLNDGLYCEEAQGEVYQILHDGSTCYADDCTWVESEDAYYESDEVVYSEDEGKAILSDDAYYCECDGNYYLDDEELVKVDDDYYLVENCCNTEDEGWQLTNECHHVITDEYPEGLYYYHLQETEEEN